MLRNDFVSICYVLGWLENIKTFSHNFIEHDTHSCMVSDTIICNWAKIVLVLEEFTSMKFKAKYMPM